MKLAYARPLFEAIAQPEPGLDLFHAALDSDATLPIAAGAALLSADENARAARFHFAKDADRFVRGRAFLRSVLAQVTGLAPQALAFEYGPMGKPGLQSAPDLWFNMTHSGARAVLVVSRNGPIGVDLESPGRTVDVLRLGQTCLVETENRSLAELPDLARQRLFLAFWMAKEARMKLTGEGLALAPRAITLDLQSGWPVGYLRPFLPHARLRFVGLPDSGQSCCIATLAEAGH